MAILNATSIAPVQLASENSPIAYHEIGRKWVSVFFVDKLVLK